MSKRLLLILLLLGTVLATGCLKTTAPVLGGVRGKVFDSNGHVLRGAKVEIYGGDHTVITDELGRYALVDINPGQQKLVATYQGKSVVKIVEVPRGGVLEGADLTFAVIDGLPPIITDVKVASVSENVAEITWVTSELADSIIDYATGPVGLGSYYWQATDSAMVLDHSLQLTGLMPNVTYHFRVRSRDGSGNEGVSSDYQFTTPAGDAPSMPLAFVVSLPTEMERLTFSWTTGSESDLLGYNLYRAETKNGPFSRVNVDPIPPSASGTTTFRDEGLKIAAKFYYQLKAVDSAKNESVPTETLAMVTPGSLSENRTWTAAESPYVVYGDIRVRGGAILTLEPGVEARFSQTDSLPDSNGASMTELIVQGGLTAIGTPDKRVLFTSASTFPTKGNWGGVKFISTSEPANQMKYATVLFGDTGVRSEGSTPTLENLEVGMCGVGFDLGLSFALNVRFCTVRDCDVGLVSAGSNIRNNIFVGNQIGAAVLGNDVFENNTVDCLVGVQIPFGTPAIRNNIIAYTGVGQALFGIQQTQPTATPTISFNDIFNYNTAIDGVTTATGPGNIASNPLFIGGNPFDYHLQTVAAGYASNSPCLTAGDSGVQMGRYGP